MTTKVKKSFQTSKRRLATAEGTLIDLQKELPLLFRAFYEAVKDFEREIIQTPAESRARGFEASLLNSKVLHRIQENFPRNWKFGRYKRFLLQISGYNILIKKLNNKNMPMNIRTLNTEAINNQQMLPLFDLPTITNPIVYFGYKKDRFGSVTEPKLVYVDESKVNWIITEDQIQPTQIRKIVPAPVLEAEPRLRNEKRVSKISNS